MQIAKQMLLLPNLERDKSMNIIALCQIKHHYIFKIAPSNVSVKWGDKQLTKKQKVKQQAAPHFLEM